MDRHASNDDALEVLHLLEKASDWALLGHSHVAFNLEDWSLGREW